MDHGSEKDQEERRTSNADYIPTKCRITKPPPPKPATNPLQFVKVAPCPLFQKAQEQIKKVEEIKKERKEVREEAEDWQANLDNWKSSRRKRQEHIIERVVEVKKLTQEENEKQRRKSKTFSEMLENRGKGRRKFSIPIYDDDDSNDLSDYGIGSNASKTDSIKDVDTDDSNSILDDTDQPSNTYYNQEEINQRQEGKLSSSDKSLDNETNLYSNNNTKPNVPFKPVTAVKTTKEPLDIKENNKLYTYEGAIQDYRSRIKSKIHIDESVFTRPQDNLNKSKEYTEAQVVVPKGEFCKRKEIFDKPLEIRSYDSYASRRLSEDFINTQSIKQRLKSLEMCTDQSSKNSTKDDVHLVSVRERLENFNKQTDNSNTINLNNNNKPAKISNYLIKKSHSSSSFSSNNTKSNLNLQNKDEIYDRSSSPETELYMNKLNMFNRDLDNLMMYKKSMNLDNRNEVMSNSDYPASTSSTELLGTFSDRDDSGINTADVSCSVSQAEEPFDGTCSQLNDMHVIAEEKLLDEIKKLEEQHQEQNTHDPVSDVPVQNDTVRTHDELNLFLSKENIINCTIELLNSLKIDASEHLKIEKAATFANKSAKLGIEDKNVDRTHKKLVYYKNIEKPVIYENVEIKPFTSSKSIPVDFITSDLLSDPTFPLVPPKLEPPKVKPPPPPPVCEDDSVASSSLSLTQRLKKEIHVKRSSFLGLSEASVDQISSGNSVEKPPDINCFLQKESKLERTLYKKALEENRLGLLTKVESQDSGLDIDRGRLSSDTWCTGESSVPSHDRQDSDHTNSITSEEDEIAKKEREIIEMVEKEEKSRDNDYNVFNDNKLDINTSPKFGAYSETVDNNKVTSQYLNLQPTDYIDDQDSEVLKVERELQQLEREELDRQRENLLFRESRAKAHLRNNRHSLENICDEVFPPHRKDLEYRRTLTELTCVPMEYRKSMPDVLRAYNSIPEIDMPYRKSMPDIQQVYRMGNEYFKQQPENLINLPPNHRKSLPELQQEGYRSAFKLPLNRQPIMPGRPLRLVAKEQKDRLSVSDSAKYSSGQKQLPKHNLSALSTVPKLKPVESWRIAEPKNYNQHWLYQEAELRRISEQQKVLAARKQQNSTEKHLPDSVIQTLTQRVQNRASLNNDRNLMMRRMGSNPNMDYMHRQYLSNNQPVGCPLPMSYSSSITVKDSPERMLSVSGKKKCSYCGKELGRGAAMIIESLCLFYHMECFKCCVCHIQLGDGLMGTDVRVRNQKLHCHSCFSSDDGIKFSCV